MFPEVPGEDERFTVQSISYENDNDNDTVFILVSADQFVASSAESPTILLGWRTKEVSCTGGGTD